MNIFSEKNKLAPSQESVTCVFDKRTGLHKFWSEYTFLSEMTRSELKYFKEEKNLCYPLSMRKSGPQVFLEFVDPITGNSQHTSEKFYRKNAYEKYLAEETFRNAFDYVMSIAVEQRITNGLFKLRNSGAIELITPDEILDDTTPPNSDNVEVISETEEPKKYTIDKEVMYEPVFK